MLKEIITYLLTKSSLEAREFGHLYESISLIEREKRCRSFWKSHQENCQKHIISSIEILNKKNRLLILGSGPLQEIPLRTLASQFNTIDLVDIVHLNEVKEKYHDLANINFIESDVTEIEEALLKKQLFVDKVPSKKYSDDYDLVISANILSQLSIHIKNFIENKIKATFNEEQILKICQIVSENHFKYLLSFKCPIILISDVETHYYSKRGELIDQDSPPFDFTKLTLTDFWWWDVAPLSELSKEYSMKMKVCAFNLNFPN